MTTIQLGTVLFNDFETSGWVFTDLTGWQGQTDDKTPVTERPQTHGAFGVSRSLRASRAITFRAIFLGDTVAQVEDAVDTLSAVGAEGPVTLTVTTDSGATFREVSVELVDAADNKNTTEGVVAVDVIARDPRRYADAPWVSTGPPEAGDGLVWPAVWPLVWPGGGSTGRVTLTNTGKAPSAPMFRLTGGFDSALITCVETGARIGFDRPLPGTSSVVVEVDVASRRAVIDGQSDVSRFLRFREWEDVPALSSRSFQFDVVNPSGSPLLEGRVFPAWW